MDIVDLSSDSPSPIDEQSHPNVVDVLELDEPSNNENSKSSNDSNPQSYFMTLDRAAMERERLLRISKAMGGGRAKRARAESDDEVTMENADDDSNSERNSYKLNYEDSFRQSNDSNQVQSMEAKRQREDVTNQLPFPCGVVKRTAVAGYSRTGNDISIGEVLQAVRFLTIHFSLLWKLNC